MKKNIVKTLAIGLIALIVLLLVTGCNQQIFDTEYTFNYAYCDYETMPKEVKIKKWNDYENSDSVQIIDENGNVYLAHYSKCVLTKEKIGG